VLTQNSNEVLAQRLPLLTMGLVRTVTNKNPMHRNFLHTALGNVLEHEVAHLERYLEFCVQTGRDVEYLADCYLTIVRDTLREQVFFQKNDRYRYSTFSEVSNSVYFNRDYMSRYMYGLAITSFLWPNHLQMQRYFRRTLPSNASGRYLEIGPGHGYFLLTAIEHSSFSQFLGIDISETSIGMSQALVDHLVSNRRADITLRCMDFLRCDLHENSFDAVVMGEVLEHVERPDLFLGEIERVAKPGCYIFLTTCINAPAVDHIYLFRDTSKLENLLCGGGLNIRDRLICPYEGKSVAECVERSLPMNVAYVLEKT
jgi:2-polyprenyl-3-methyl-5-hydroxy-6-metoxy-1,4-benzoquinol methylase